MTAKSWSTRQDSNLRPPEPKSGALPDCATDRSESPALWANHLSTGDSIRFPLRVQHLEDVPSQLAELVSPWQKGVGTATGTTTAHDRQCGAGV